MPTRFRLANGLTVVFEPQHAAKVAAFQIWVKVGSADELPHEEGLAHLHEHMLFKGTAKRGLGEIARSVEAHGGEINAWTSYEQTAYHVVLASRYAREGLDVLADAVRASAFDADELSREIEVVCEEIKRSLDMPSRRASRDLFATRYHSHPYGRPVIGSEAAVRSHTRERVLEFYRKHYRPSNMVLAAAGDFTESQLREWAEQLLGGDWGRGEAPPPPAPVQSLEVPQTSVLVRPDDVKETWLNLAFAIPGVDHPDAAGLDVLAMVAGQGDASRLSLSVKRQRSLVNEIHAYAWTPRGPGTFALGLTAQPQKAIEAFAAAATVLRELQTHEVGDDELSTVKALIESEAIYQRETAQGLARKLGYYEAACGGIEREAAYYEQVAQVSSAQLKALAQKYFTFERAVVTGLAAHGATLDEGALRSALAAAAVAQPQRAAPGRKAAAKAQPLKVTASNKRETGLLRHVLPSGATVLVREERAVPLFAVRAVYPGGLRYENEQSNGLTSLLARTMTRGTRSHDAEDISHLVDGMAGGLAAMAGRSSVSLRGEFLSKHFDRAFDLFAEVLNYPTYPEGEVQRERALQLQSIASRDDRPSSVAFELVAKALYHVHPYRLPTLGDKDSVERLSAEQLRAFHAAYVSPQNLTLCIVGDVDSQEVLTKAEAAFGAASAAARPAPQVPVEPERREATQTTKTLAKAQSHLVIAFPGARVSDPWRRPLEVLSTLLSGQSGRLFLQLRDKQSLCYSVSSMTVEGVDPGYFAVYMATSPEKVRVAVDGIRQELKRLTDERVADSEMQRAREHLLGVHDIGLQRNGARAATMALDHCYGLGAEAFLRYADEVMAVTADDVRNVAQRVLDFERCATVTVGP